MNEEPQGAPLPIKIISILLMIFGVAWIAIAGLTLAFIGIPGLALIAALLGASIIVIAIGLRKMKRWALYLYTAGAVLQTTSTLNNILGLLRTEGVPVSVLWKEGEVIVYLLWIVVDIAILAYLWKNKRLFR